MQLEDATRMYKLRLHGVKWQAGENDHSSCTISIQAQSRILLSAGWRKKPASDSQKQLIAKRWRVRPGSYGGFSSEEERMDKIHHLTKGQAANILTRLKHGAQVCPTWCTLQLLTVYIIGPFREKTEGERSNNAYCAKRARPRCQRSS